MPKEHDTDSKRIAQTKSDKDRHSPGVFRRHLHPLSRLNSLYRPCPFKPLCPSLISPSARVRDHLNEEQSESDQLLVAKNILTW